MSKQQGKRLSILKKRPSVAAMTSEESSPVTATTVALGGAVKGTKKIGFNRKKSIREFITTEETGTLWMNSYELSTDGTPSSNAMSETLLGATLPEGAEQDKENQTVKPAADDTVKRSSPNASAWELSISAYEDERRWMKTPETLQNFSILNNTERLYPEPLGPPRPILKQIPVGCPRVGPVLVPDVEAMDISPVKPLSGARIQSPRKTRYYHPQQNMFVTIDDVVRMEPRPDPGVATGTDSEQWRKKSSIGLPGINLSEAWNSHPATALKLGLTKRDSAGDMDSTIAISQSVAKLLAGGSLAQLNSLENTKLTVDDETGMWDESTTDVKIPLNALARARPSFVPSEGRLSIVKQELADTNPTLNVSSFQRKPNLDGVSFGDLTLALNDSARRTLVKAEEDSMKPVAAVDCNSEADAELLEEEEKQVTSKAGTYFRRPSSNVLSDFIFGANSLELKIPETPVMKTKVLLPPKRSEQQPALAARKTLLLDNDPMEQDAAQSRLTGYEPTKMDESKLVNLAPVSKQRQTTYAPEAIGQSCAKDPKRPTLHNNEPMVVGSPRTRKSALAGPNPVDMQRKSSYREECMRVCVEEVTEARIHRPTVHRAKEMEQTHVHMEQREMLDQRDTRDNTLHYMEDMNETNRRFMLEKQPAEPSRSTTYGQRMMDQSMWRRHTVEPVSHVRQTMHNRQDIESCLQDSAVPASVVNSRPTTFRQDAMEELLEPPIAEVPGDGNQTVLQPVAMEEITVGIQCHAATQAKTRLTTYDRDSIESVSEEPRKEPTSSYDVAPGRQTLYRQESMEETTCLRAHDALNASAPDVSGSRTTINQGLAVDQTAVQHRDNHTINGEAPGTSVIRQTLTKSRSSSHVVENVEETNVYDVESLQPGTVHSRESTSSSRENYVQQIVDGESAACNRESTEEVRFFSSLKQLGDSCARATLYRTEDLDKSSTGSPEVHGNPDSRVSKSQTTVYDLDDMEETMSPRVVSSARQSVAKSVENPVLEPMLRFPAKDQPLLQQFRNRNTVYYQDPMEETTVTLLYLKGGAVKTSNTGSHPEVIEQTKAKAKVEESRSTVAANGTRLTTFASEDMDETALVDQTSRKPVESVTNFNSSATAQRSTVVPAPEMPVQRKPTAMRDASTSYSIPAEMQRTTGVVTSPGQIFRLPAAQNRLDAEITSSEEYSQFLSSTRPNCGSLTMHTLTDGFGEDGSMDAFLAAEKYTANSVKSARNTTFQPEAMDETPNITSANESWKRQEPLPTLKGRETVYNQSVAIEESFAPQFETTSTGQNSKGNEHKLVEDDLQSAVAPTSNVVLQEKNPLTLDHRTANATEMLEVTNSRPTMHSKTELEESSNLPLIDVAFKPRRSVHFGLVTENVYSKNANESTERSINQEDCMNETEPVVQSVQPELQHAPAPITRSRETILVPQDMEESTVINATGHIKQEEQHSFAAPMLPRELADDRVMRSGAPIAPLHFSFIDQSISAAPADFSKDFKSTTLRTVNGTVPLVESVADELNEFSTITDTTLPQRLSHLVRGQDISIGFREITEPPMKPLPPIAVSVIRETPIKEERDEGNGSGGEEEEFFDAEEEIVDVPAVCQTMKFVDVDQMEQTNVHRQTIHCTKSVLQDCDSIAPDGCQTVKFVDIDQLEQTENAMSSTIKRQISQISKSVLYGDDPLNVSLPESLPLKKRRTLDRITEEDDDTAAQQQTDYAAAIETITVKQERLSIADNDPLPDEGIRHTFVRDATIFVTEGDDMLADESNPTLLDHSPDARRMAYSDTYDKNYQEIVNITDDTCISADNSCILVSDDSGGDLQLNISDPPQVTTELSDLPVRLQKTRLSLVLESTIASEVMDEIMQKFPQTKHPCCGFQDKCVCTSRRLLETRQRELQIVRTRWQNAIGRFKDRVREVPVRKLTLEEQIEEVMSKRRMYETRYKEQKLTLAAPFPETPSLRMLCNNLISYLTEVANEAEKPLACHLPATPSVCLLVRNKLRTDGSRWQLDNSEACFGRLALRHRTLRSVVIDINLQKPIAKDSKQQQDMRLQSIQLLESSESFVNSPKLFLAHREFMAVASETSMREVRANYRTTGALMGLVNHFDTILGQVFDLVNRLQAILRNNHALLYVDQNRFYVKRAFSKRSTLMTNVLYVQFDRIQDISDAGLWFKVPFPETARILASAERTTGTTPTARALMFLESMLWHLQTYIDS